MVEKRLTTDAMHRVGEAEGGGGGDHHLGGSAKQRGQGYISIPPLDGIKYKKLTFSSFLKLSCPRWLNQQQGGTSWQPFGEREIGHKIFVRHVFAIFRTNLSFLRVIEIFQIRFSIRYNICNIYHIIVHFLPNKHCFYPKKTTLFLSKVFQQVRKLRQTSLNFPSESKLFGEGVTQLLPPWSIMNYGKSKRTRWIIRRYCSFGQF